MTARRTNLERRGIARELCLADHRRYWPCTSSGYECAYPRREDMRWIGSVVTSLAAIGLAYAMLAAQGSRFSEAIQARRSSTGTVRITGCLQRADRGGAPRDGSASSGCE